MLTTPLYRYPRSETRKLAHPAYSRRPREYTVRSDALRMTISKNELLGQVTPLPGKQTLKQQRLSVV
jgi:hypothetical protein